MKQKNDALESEVETVHREHRKRKREIVIAILLGVMFLILSGIGLKMIETSQRLPFVHSIFFFGLVNFNIILLLFLLFLIFRNVVKVFVERTDGVFGGSLKSKLVAAFVALSVIPTVLMFAISVFYINSSFDKWFSVKVAGVLRDSLDITNAYYLSTKKKNYHFAHLVAQRVRSAPPRSTQKILREGLESLSLDAVEYYPDLFAPQVMVISEEDKIPSIPRPSLEFLQKGITQGIDASTIHHFGEGNLIRVIVPIRRGGQKGAIVVSSYIPLSLTSKMDEIAAAYDDFRDLNPLEYPLKSIYLIILVLMTLMILFAGTWFGFHLARQLSTPLEKLAKAAQQVAKGHYVDVNVQSSSSEINLLVDSFNHMVKDISDVEKEILSVNRDLKSTLTQLDERNRYMEVILSNISTGVVSIDSKGVVTTINRHAGKLLKTQPEQHVGKKLRDLLSEEYFTMYESLITTLRQYKAYSLQKELRLQLGGENLLIQMTLSILRDEKKNELGLVLVFDDMSTVVNAQRAAAWREVARRIAHEIKNPLTPIKLSAQRIEKKFGQDIQDPAFSQCVKTIIEQVDSIRDLVNEFSQFARLPQANLVSGSLNQVIQDALVLYQTGHKDIQFQTQFDPRLPNFEFDPDQIKRVMSNLLDNSVAAFEESKLESACIEIETKYDNALGIARLLVKDNGPGIPENLRSRIFDPYFTTKEKGTGLGLAIVRRIIEDHSGFIRASANEPHGTRIVIEFPVVKSQFVAPIDDGKNRAEKDIV